MNGDLQKECNYICTGTPPVYGSQRGLSEKFNYICTGTPPVYGSQRGLSEKFNYICTGTPPIPPPRIWVTARSF